MCVRATKMCDKAVSTHSSTIQSVPECYESQESRDKAFNKCFLAFIYIPDRYKSPQMCDRVISY